MADKRPFFKMDVGYFDNPKIQAIIDDHPRAVLLHAKCIAYSRQHLTDGVVPLRVAMRAVCATDADGIAAGNAGLLIALGDGNVLVHDYMEHQQSAESVKAVSQAQSQKARKRWDASGNADGTAISNASGNAEKRREELSSELRADVARVLDHLDGCIESNGAKKPGRTKANITAARLLIDKDGRTPDEIVRVIDWATGDSFWKSNILSMAKLRDKYDQIRIKSGEATPPRAHEAPVYVPPYEGDPDDIDAYQAHYAHHAAGVR
jgi:hypothetical protein